MQNKQFISLVVWLHSKADVNRFLLDSSLVNFDSQSIICLHEPQLAPFTCTLLKGQMSYSMESNALNLFVPINVKMQLALLRIFINSEPLQESQS